MARRLASAVIHRISVGGWRCVCCLTNTLRSARASYFTTAFNRLYSFVRARISCKSLMVHVRFRSSRAFSRPPICSLHVLCYSQTDQLHVLMRVFSCPLIRSLPVLRRARTGQLGRWSLVSHVSAACVISLHIQCNRA